MTVRQAGSEDYKGPTLSISLRSEACCGETKAWLCYGAITVHLATGLATFHSYHSPDNLREKTDVRTALDKTAFTEEEISQVRQLVDMIRDQVLGEVV